MEFKILGKTRLHIDGNDFDLGSTKQRAVLALLLYYTGEPVPVDRIARELWRSSAPAEVRGKLQPLISRLRAVLTKSGSGGRIHKEGDAYRLELADGLVDYHRFRKLAEAGRSAAARNDHVRAKELLREALGLWQGRPLQELDGRWADHCRDQMETFDRIPAQHALLDSRLQLREHAEVMGEAGRLTREHELDENFARLYLQSLDGLGKYSRALEFHTRFCANLMAETGAEPGPELRAAYLAILRKQAGTGPAGPAPRRVPPRDLPRDLKKFAGRADLLARMDEVLESGVCGQVIALHGMPGIGKTRLAVHWAHRRVDRFPDGQLVLDLQGFGPANPLAPDDALGILLAKLDVEPIPVTGQERRTRLRRVLDGHAVLLLLDNARDSNQVRPILDATTPCFTVITSRTRLFALPVHDDAQVIHVPQLSATESESLLCDVIGAQRVNEDPEAVNELAKRSDGHPMALRIVAEHVALRPETALADLVDEFKGPEGLGILGSSDDSDDEHATLSAAFSWSYRSLPAACARMFRMLGLHFTTEFGPEAASALIGEPISTTTRYLSALTKANLLQYGAARRFRLHDLMHGYAVDLVRHEESPATRKTALTGLLDHYLATATAAYARLTPDQSPVPPLDGVPPAAPFTSDQKALDWFAKERANLVTAILRAVGHGFHEHAWRLAANVQEIFDRLGYYEDLLVCQRAALEAAMVSQGVEGRAGALNDIGTVHFRLGQYGAAAECFERSVEAAREHGLPQVVAVAVYNLARVHLAQNQVGQAVVHLHATLDSARTLHMPALEAATLRLLGRAHRCTARDDSALDFFTSALAIWDRIGDVRGRGTTLIDISRLLHQHGWHDEARDRLKAALAVTQASGDRSALADALTVEAEMHYDLGEFRETVDCAQRAVALDVEAGTAAVLARALHMLGHALVALGDPAAAERHWTKAAALLSDLDGNEGASLQDHLDELRHPGRPIPNPRDFHRRPINSSTEEVPLT
ncbi:AfsR/SARP family transcriptional regulator [Saccharothrix australiensis]|uniref:DNA-binding SARP family transcriptional activator n=1 Tax=Saccharothrix australiensis TaxID=2072 RepID=A0A495VW61_9PSEU|nr:BTAD domain-containing putative transcriptional regulator [Saccharothrix australiensis]RKT52947.1 DNA-binding SARP family transcriptional activator [Saccharothrix australiensis]